MSTKQVAGTSLFSDLEGFMADLSEHELELVGGGGKGYKKGSFKKSSFKKSRGSKSGYGRKFPVACLPICPPPRWYPTCYH
jgi:hypothetical protein